MATQRRARRDRQRGAACLITILGVGACHGDREQWQKPEQVIESLAIEAGDTVADLGAGDGYFTFLLAGATGPEGKVFAIDTDASALEDLSKVATERGLDHVETIVAAAEDPGLETSSVDLILVSNTYHHLEDRTAYFARIMPALRPGGRIAIIELDSVPWYLGPFLSDHETSPETIREEMEAAGYARIADHTFLDHQNFQVFSVTLARIR